MWQERISIAPMMGYTDRHFRYFMRQLTRHTVLYTEMVTTGALLFGDVAQHLAFHPDELPLVLQLGGNDPAALAQCAILAENWGYSAVNLNVGCPSSRVQNGQFGACLMKQPQVVADAVAAMRASVAIPVTVKTRIGVDDHDSYDQLHHYIATVAAAGCQYFIIHARKAWLNGLSPKENREIPPLRYDIAAQLKHDFPHLWFSLNGGLRDLRDAHTVHAQFDGLMIGRAAYENPYAFASVDQDFFGAEHAQLSRATVVERLLPYIDQVLLSHGLPITWVTRHLHNLFRGEVHGKQWRRYLAEHTYQPGAGYDVIHQALQIVS